MSLHQGSSPIKEMGFGFGIMDKKIGKLRETGVVQDL